MAIAELEDPRHEAALVTSARQALQERDRAQPGSLINAFLLQVGERFAPTARPPDISKMPTRYCFRNATDLILQHSDWTFGEGYALVADGTLIEHGWVVTPAGVVVDPTIELHAVLDYLGVVYERERYLEWIEACRGDQGVLWSFTCRQRVIAALNGGEAPVPLASRSSR